VYLETIPEGCLQKEYSGFRKLSRQNVRHNAYYHKIILSQNIILTPLLGYSEALTMEVNSQMLKYSLFQTYTLKA